MADTPKLAPSMTQDGMNIATFDAIVALCRALWKTQPELKDEFSRQMLERLAVEQGFAAHGSVMNQNAAVALQILMVQTYCNNIPELPGSSRH